MLMSTLYAVIGIHTGRLRHFDAVPDVLNVNAGALVSERTER